MLVHLYQNRTRAKKGKAPPTFVTQSPLQRHIRDGEHSERVGSIVESAVFQEIKPNVFCKNNLSCWIKYIVNEPREQISKSQSSFIQYSIVSCHTDSALFTAQ